MTGPIIFSEKVTSFERPAIFLDRDGTLIEDVHYLNDLKAMRLIAGVAAAVHAANASGHPVVVVTNQSGVARGYFDEAFVRESGEHLQTLLAQAGASLNGYYYCPYHPLGRAPYDRDHPDRKPGAGMLLRAAEDLALTLDGAYMIGDKLDDLATGAKLGVIPLLVRTGYGEDTAGKLPEDFSARGGRIFPDAGAAIHWVIERESKI